MPNYVTMQARIRCLSIRIRLFDPMMKAFYTLLCCAFALSAFAQDSQIPVNLKTGQAEYTDVVTVAGTADTTLHKRALAWINEFYTNPNGVIQSNDSLAKKIEGKARFRLTTAGAGDRRIPSGYVAYSFSMEFKEGRYRYQVYRIHWQKPSYYDVSRWEDKEDPNYDEELYPQFIEQTLTYFNQMLDSMEEHMATAEEQESSAW